MNGCEFRGLRWRLLYRTVNSAKVVVSHEQGERVTMILNRLAITNGQASESAIENASRQVQPFGVARIDFATVWTTKASATANA